MYGYMNISALLGIEPGIEDVVAGGRSSSWGCASSELECR